MLNAICAEWGALMDAAFADQPTLKARNVGSLYALAEHADRAFDPLLTASDGRVYFGAMPHHPTEGGPLFAFDPKRDKLSLLGDIDRLAGVYQPGVAVPSMVHASAVEMNGRLYFTGQDPFYGGYGFPLEDPEKRPHYRGSPILEYDLKAGKSRGLGIPVPGDNSLFRITADPKRNVLYVRRGYARDYYAPLIWYAIALDASGNLGAAKALPFESHPSDLLIATDGTIYCVIPDRERWEQHVAARASRQKTDPIAPRCHVYQLVAGADRPERLGTIEGTWDVNWCPWQHGQATAIGVGETNVHRISLQSGAVETLAKGTPQFRGHGCIVQHQGKLWTIAWVQPKIRAARSSALFSLDPITGQSLCYGAIVDDAGRRVKDLNHFTFLPDGRLFAAGTLYGLPSDRHSMNRYRDGEPYRLDSGCVLIEKIPAGPITLAVIVLYIVSHVRSRPIHPRHPFPSSATPARQTTGMCAIAKFDNQMEAHLAAGRLETEGIGCQVEDNEMHVELMYRGFSKLLVSEDDQTRAIELLARTPARKHLLVPQSELPPAPVAAADTCPKCGASDYQRAWRIKLLVLGLLLLTPLLFLGDLAAGLFIILAVVWVLCRIWNPPLRLPGVRSPVASG